MKSRFLSNTLGAKEIEILTYVMKKTLEVQNKGITRKVATKKALAPIYL